MSSSSPQMQNIAAKKEEEKSTIQAAIVETENQLKKIEELGKDAKIRGRTFSIDPPLCLDRHSQPRRGSSTTSAPTSASNGHSEASADLQFLQGQLMSKKKLLEDLRQQSARRETSLLDQQTLHTLKAMQEDNKVSELSNFWRRAALTHQMEKKPQIESNPDWAKSISRTVDTTGPKDAKDYWHHQLIEEEDEDQVTQRPSKEHLQRKEEQWASALDQKQKLKFGDSYSDDATNPQLKSEVEVLCDLIHSKGEQYEDGTAAISITYLAKTFNRVNLVGTLMRARKFGLLYFDGEILTNFGQEVDDDDNCVILQKPIEEIRSAFEAMRARHPEIYEGAATDAA